MSTEPVRAEITLPAPVGEVWQAFQDPALIRLDLAALADLEIRWSAWWNGHFKSGD